MELETTAGTRSKFNRSNDNIDWAWWTWNPVTGCEHDCPYCYARDIANRFYPEKFEPTFHPDRLTAPANTRVPKDGPPQRRNVFVCSMADLFGKWVAQEWIDRVIAAVRANPQWQFLFLTKFPPRLVDVNWPDNAWVGTTVDIQRRVRPAEKFLSMVNARHRWVSCEPMEERLEFENLALLDLLVIGARSRSSGSPEFQPDWEWVVDLSAKAKAAGTKVYWKENLRFSWPKEVPDIQESLFP